MAMAPVPEIDNSYLSPPRLLSNFHRAILLAAAITCC